LLVYWAKCKYTELVADASMEVGLEENVEKNQVYFMPCNQSAGQNCNKIIESWVLYDGMVEASIFLG
jgi:translation elongation factor EF-1alpha